MSSINKAMILGICGRDPDIRYTNNDLPIAKISIATNEMIKDRNTGNKEQVTEWHNVTLFGRLAEVAGQFLKKGKLVYIEGQMKTTKYVDKDGTEKKNFEIIGKELKLIGKKDDSPNGSDPIKKQPEFVNQNVVGDINDEIPF